MPIWHNIVKNEIVEVSPILADIVGIPTNNGINKVAQAVLKVVKPQGSPLIIARDILLKHKYKPPIVTDEWWLNVVEASNAVDNFWGMVEPEKCWGRWSFPLPDKGNSPEERGFKLAWTAMQMNWTEEAYKQQITQITRPDKVLKFIKDQPGLDQICRASPYFLATYAPQLTIRGFSGDFEHIFDEYLMNSIRENESLNKSNPNCGTALTVNKKPPSCEEVIALRHPTFGNYSCGIVAGQFVNGELHGPCPKKHETIDYIVWLLSSQSNWLPNVIRQFLLAGMAELAAWKWSKYEGRDSLDYAEYGQLFEEMISSKKYGQFEMSNSARNDLFKRLHMSIKQLEIHESAEEIADLFNKYNFIKMFIKRHNKRRR